MEEGIGFPALRRQTTMCALAMTDEISGATTRTPQTRGLGSACVS